MRRKQYGALLIRHIARYGRRNLTGTGLALPQEHAAARGLRRYRGIEFHTDRRVDRCAAVSGLQIKPSAQSCVGRIPARVLLPAIPVRQDQIDPTVFLHALNINAKRPLLLRHSEWMRRRKLQAVLQIFKRQGDVVVVIPKP